ncbi:vanadium-dependent haloperoxidase [Archangium sp.]|uniref:vanadium-dependent haloperoxidase n=1 Tax=Archangium sp. TaxID=1872627 RepID=UPI00286B8C31|nr:vanadium-dependent haloperoxidase [Archangium sp.]
MAAKAHTLSDNFNDNTTDSRWKIDNDAREVNQRVEARPPHNSNDGYAGYHSAVTYDLTGSSVKLEVLQILTVADGNTYLRVGDTANGARLLAVNGKLTCTQILGGVVTTLASVPYEPVNHRWWQLREFGGTTFWEASSDGQNWVTLFSKSNFMDLTQVTLVFRALTNTPHPSPGMAIFGAFNAPSARLSRRVEERRLSAQAVREQAAALAAGRHHPEHANNNDEVNYPDRSFIGNYSKALQHDSLGDPDPISYGSLLRALQSRDPGDFEEILQPSGALKLTNPQAGLAFDLEGPDAQAVTQPPAPRFDSDQTAAEMGELYWMALARDIPFVQYDAQASTAGSPLAQAISSLNTEFPRFGGKVPVTAQNLFRGIYPGEQVGPYVSQFLLKGNIDPRKPDGQGRNANDGFITYGSRVIDQRQWTVKAGVDYLTRFNEDWLPVQNGRDDRGKDQFDMTQRRFIRNLRDGANFVHFDQVVDAFYNTAFYLLSEPLGNQSTGSSAGTGRPQLDKEFTCNVGHPYDPPGTAMDARRQVGFATFGPVHLLQTLIEVAGRAARAVWWQKWGVHRRLRPEEYGGRVDNHLNGRRAYNNLLHPSLLTSLSTGGLAPYFPERYGSYLLPQAYSEGCPTHPAYGAGHATVSGACVTILKAFFNEAELIQSPVVANDDGTALVPYAGSGATQMTVGGELNKLAGNISLFRSAGGVHWRSDYTESLPLGEEVAIGLLQEMSLTFNEDDAFFQFTRFNGVTVRVYKGIVEPLVTYS